jgi:hypothetical protein
MTNRKKLMTKRTKFTESHDSAARSVAESAAHAKKFAAEKRQEWLRSKR